MHVKALLLLAAVAVGATCVAGGTVKRATKGCNQYPYGYTYTSMGKVFTTATNCLSKIKVTKDECAYAAVEGIILASEHEQYSNSDFRKTVSHVSACLKKTRVNQANIDKVEQCLVDGLSPY